MKKVRKPVATDDRPKPTNPDNRIHPSFGDLAFLDSIIERFGPDAVLDAQPGDDLFDVKRCMNALQRLSLADIRRAIQALLTFDRAYDNVRSELDRAAKLYDEKHGDGSFQKLGALARLELSERLIVETLNNSLRIPEFAGDRP